MKHLNAHIPMLLVLFLSQLSLAAPTTGGKCGGNGPTPIINEKVSPSYANITTVGSVLDFTVSEANSEILYRTDTKELFSMPFGSKKSVKIADAPYALSPVLDKKGKYLVTEPDSYFWELGKSLDWQKTTLTPAPQTPAFWDGNQLYSIREEDDSLGNPVYQVVRYQAGETASRKYCGQIPAQGLGYELATGHAYPYLYFYKRSSYLGGSNLTVYRFDLRSCYMSPMGTYKSVIPGNVQWVHWFDSASAIGVATDDPAKTFFYDPGYGQCRYYTTGGPVMLVNPKQPVVAAIKADNSAELIHLTSGTIQDLTTTETYYSSVKSRAMYLTNDGKKLFILSDAGGTAGLIQATVKP